jgi:hypothetical protein
MAIARAVRSIAVGVERATNAAIVRSSTARNSIDPDLSNRGPSDQDLSSRNSSDQGRIVRRDRPKAIADRVNLTGRNSIAHVASTLTGHAAIVRSGTGRAAIVLGTTGHVVIVPTTSGRATTSEPASAHASREIAAIPLQMIVREMSVAATIA